MPKFAANLTMLFTDRPLPDRIAAAADAGFDAVEIPFPYDNPAIEIRNALGRTGLPLVLINAPPPNYTGGAAGHAALPGGSRRFRHDFNRALRYADTLKAARLHVMAGAAEGAEAFDTMVENLRWATQEAPGWNLVIEPMNDADLPGYFLRDFDLAARVIDAVDAPNLGLIFDTYQAERITGDMLACWAEHGHRAHHVQVAGLIDRHEPDGMVDGFDLPGFCAMLDAAGYDGWVGADYHPRGRTTDGLAWLARAREGRGAIRRPA